MKRPAARFFAPLLAATFLALIIAAAPARTEDAPHVTTPDEAQRLYQANGDAVYQVQVIDIASGKKAAIGSGFQFTADGLIATNYHVIATALQKPEGNRIEFRHDKDQREGGATGPLHIVIADAVNDLAILRMETPGKDYLRLGTSHLPKGAKLFALGNPHDLGFTIIEGTYNGLSKESFIDKIHFSGSLNPGMSGGPAIGHDGTVAGVNVATAGNQISFLVPVEPLKKLADEAAKQPKGYDFVKNAHARLEEQLLALQSRNVQTLLGRTWEGVNFFPVAVPGRIHDALKCWGGISHKDEDPYENYYSMCASQDRIFLDTGFDTGIILYRYNYMAAKDNLNLSRFYDFYQTQFSTPTADYQNAKESDVTNFDCNSRFTDIADQRWKASFCVRQYKKYPQLYDMHLYMALVGAGKKGFTITLMAQGVSQENGLALAQRFMNEVRVPVRAPAAEPSKEEATKDGAAKDAAGKGKKPS